MTLISTSRDGLLKYLKNRHFRQGSLRSALRRQARYKTGFTRKWKKNIK